MRSLRRPLLSRLLASIRCRTWLASGLALAAGSVGALAIDAADPTASPKIEFEERLIADGYGYAYGVAAADLDRDGKLDLTSCDTRGDALYWYRNLGAGKFERRFIQKSEPGWFERHAIGDLDGDGDLDVVIVKNLDGHLVWFENSGQPTRDEVWNRQVITTDLKRAYDVALVDLNADGRLDVAASAWNGNHVAWFANPGKDGFASEWTKQMVDPQLGEARTIRVGDFNGDRQPDLLCTGRTANRTAWYERTNDPNEPWRRHVIDDQSPQPVHGEPCDLDGDGDLDVVMALGMLANIDQPDTNRVVWYENVGRPGLGKEWKLHRIADLAHAFEAIAADLDGDRDLDVIATAWGGPGQIHWYEKSDDPREPWRPHPLKTKWPRANQPIVADLDGDQRLDIIASAENGSNEVRWWRQK